MNTIYLLTSPLSGKARYIGITMVSAERRVARHMRSANAGSKHRVHAWLRALAKAGSAPLLTVLEVTDDRTREVQWISSYRALGHPLLNSTIGGDGLVNPSAWTRKKMSESGKRRPPISDETRAKLRAQSRPHTEETRAKMRVPKSEAHRKAAADALAAVRAKGQFNSLVGDKNPMRKHPELVKRGADVLTSKLSDEAVAKILKLHAEGMSTVKLGKLFGVSQATAWRVVRRICWKHVEAPMPPQEAVCPAQLALKFA